MDKKKKILLAVIFAALIPVCVFLVFAVRAPSARIALVIDDFGYNTKNVDAFLGLKAPVTFSILPNLPYSGR
ncbi:MAG: divergent polysaccharide deacetylase family protein, partial [Candidatus Omnitrophota bacterium]